MTVQDFPLEVSSGFQVGHIRKVVLTLDEWADLGDRLDAMGLGAIVRAPGAPILLGGCVFVVDDLIPRPGAVQVGAFGK